VVIKSKKMNENTFVKSISTVHLRTAFTGLKVTVIACSLIRNHDNPSIHHIDGLSDGWIIRS